MVLIGRSQEVYNRGLVQYIDNSYNSLQFSFDVSLQGGTYQCKNINAVTDLNPSKVSTFLKLCLLAKSETVLSTIAGAPPEMRWLSDFEILFFNRQLGGGSLRNGGSAYNTSYFFGGNDVGGNIGSRQIARWDTQFRSASPNIVYYTNNTLPIQVAFDSVCVVNSCKGSATSHCLDYTNFTGSFEVNGFRTTSALDINRVNSPCIATRLPSLIPSAKPTTKPTSLATRIPTVEPSASPSANPTNTPSVYPTANPTAEPSASPSANPTNTPSVYPTANPTVEPSASPSANPTNTPSVYSTAKPTPSPSARPTATPTLPGFISLTSFVPTVKPTPSPVTVPLTRPTAVPTTNNRVVLTNTSGNALTFSFDVTLAPNTYSCAPINSATTVNASLTKTFFQISFSHTTTQSRFASDFELLLLKDNMLPGSQFLGGTFLVYGENNRKSFPSSYRQRISSCVYWSDYTDSKIEDEFNNVCIFNSCGSYNIYCPESSRFTGQVILNNFATTSNVNQPSFTPPCSPQKEVYTAYPSMLPTTAPTFLRTAMPTSRIA